MGENLAGKNAKGKPLLSKPPAPSFKQQLGVLAANLLPGLAQQGKDAATEVGVIATSPVRLLDIVAGTKLDPYRQKDGETEQQHLRRTTPLSTGLRESGARTGERLVQGLAAYAPGGIKPSEAAWAKASDEGRIVEAFTEDLGNLSIVAGGTGRVAGAANAPKAAKWAAAETAAKQATDLAEESAAHAAEAAAKAARGTVNPADAAMVGMEAEVLAAEALEAGLAAAAAREAATNGPLGVLERAGRSASTLTPFEYQRGPRSVLAPERGNLRARTPEVDTFQLRPARTETVALPFQAIGKTAKAGALRAGGASTAEALGAAFPKVAGRGLLGVNAKDAATHPITLGATPRVQQLLETPAGERATKWMDERATARHAKESILAPTAAEVGIEGKRRQLLTAKAERVLEDVDDQHAAQLIQAGQAEVVANLFKLYPQARDEFIRATWGIEDAPSIKTLERVRAYSDGTLDAETKAAFDEASAVIKQMSDENQENALAGLGAGSRGPLSPEQIEREPMPSAIEAQTRGLREKIEQSERRLVDLGKDRAKVEARVPTPNPSAAVPQTAVRAIEAVGGAKREQVVMERQAAKYRRRRADLKTRFDTLRRQPPADPAGPDSTPPTPGPGPAGPVVTPPAPNGARPPSYRSTPEERSYVKEARKAVREAGKDVEYELRGMIDANHTGGEAFEFPNLQVRFARAGAERAEGAVVRKGEVGGEADWYSALPQDLRAFIRATFHKEGGLPIEDLRDPETFVRLAELLRDVQQTRSGQKPPTPAVRAAFRDFGREFSEAEWAAIGGRNLDEAAERVASTTEPDVDPEADAQFREAQAAELGPEPWTQGQEALDAELDRLIEELEAEERHAANGDEFANPDAVQERINALLQRPVVEPTAPEAATTPPAVEGPPDPSPSAAPKKGSLEEYEAAPVGFAVAEPGSTLTKGANGRGWTVRTKEADGTRTIVEHGLTEAEALARADAMNAPSADLPKLTDPKGVIRTLEQEGPSYELGVLTDVARKLKTAKGKGAAAQLARAELPDVDAVLARIDELTPVVERLKAERGPGEPPKPWTGPTDLFGNPDYSARQGVAVERPPVAAGRQEAFAIEGSIDAPKIAMKGGVQEGLPIEQVRREAREALEAGAPRAVAEDPLVDLLMERADVEGMSLAEFADAVADERKAIEAEPTPEPDAGDGTVPPPPPAVGGEGPPSGDLPDGGTTGPPSGTNRERALGRLQGEGAIYAREARNSDAQAARADARRLKMAAKAAERIEAAMGKPMRQGEKRGKRLRDVEIVTRAQLAEARKLSWLEEKLEVEEARLAQGPIEVAPGRYKPALLAGARARRALEDMAQEMFEATGDSFAGQYLLDQAETIATTMQDLHDRGIFPEYLKGGVNERPQGAVRGPGKVLRLPKEGTLSGQRAKKEGTVLPTFRAQGRVYAEEIAKQLQNVAAEQMANDPRLVVTGRAYVQRLVDELGEEHPDAVELKARVERGGHDLGKFLEREGLSPWDPKGDNYNVSYAAVNADTLFIPIKLREQFDRQFKQVRDPAVVRWMIDNPTRVFKHMVLALNPNWNVGNAISNAMMTMTAGGLTPVEVFTYGRQVLRDLAQEGSLPSFLQKRLGGDVSGDLHFPPRLYDAGQSGEMLRFFRENTRTVEGQGIRGRMPEWLRDVHPVQASYELNNFVDNWGRSTVYLAKKAKGITDEQAVSAALNAMGDFNNMTSFERTFIRRAIPFYAWARHVTLLSARLATHHPMRVAWMLHLGGLVTTDEDYDLPEFLRGSVRLGDKVVTINYLNPMGEFGSSTLLEPREVLRSMGPVPKLIAGGAFNINLNKGGRQMSRAPGYGPVDDFENPAAGFLTPKELAWVLSQQTNQTRAVANITTEQVRRYDTGQPLKLEGKKVPLDASRPEMAAKGLGLPFVPQSFDVEGIQQTRSERRVRREAERKRYEKGSTGKTGGFVL